MTILGISISAAADGTPPLACEVSIDERRVPAAIRREALRRVLEAVSAQGYAWNVRLIDLLSPEEKQDLRNQLEVKR